MDIGEGEGMDIAEGEGMDLEGGFSFFFFWAAVGGISSVPQRGCGSGGFYGVRVLFCSETRWFEGEVYGMEEACYFISTSCA